MSKRETLLYNLTPSGRLIASEIVKLTLALTVLALAAIGGILFVGVILFTSWKEILFIVASIAIVFGVPITVLWSVAYVNKYLKNKRNI